VEDKTTDTPTRPHPMWVKITGAIVIGLGLCLVVSIGVYFIVVIVQLIVEAYIAISRL